MKTELREEILGLVKRNYQEIAENFDLTRKKPLGTEILRFAAGIKDGDRILDAGCGNGRLLGALSGKDSAYFGIDNSQELIDLAIRNYPGHNFQIADVLTLDHWPETGFSSIFSLAVWQHIPSRELRLEFLRQMARKLAPDGRLVISVWNMWRQSKYRRLLLRNCWLKIIGRNGLDYNDLIFPWKNSRGEAVSERYYHAFTKKEIRKLVRLSGLRLVELKRDKYNYWVILSN